MYDALRSPFNHIQTCVLLVLFGRRFFGCWIPCRGRYPSSLPVVPYKTSFRFSIDLHSDLRRLAAATFFSTILVTGHVFGRISSSRFYIRFGISVILSVISLFVFWLVLFVLLPQSGCFLSPSPFHHFFTGGLLVVFQAFSTWDSMKRVRARLASLKSSSESSLSKN